VAESYLLEISAIAEKCKHFLMERLGLSHSVITGLSDGRTAIAKNLINEMNPI